MALDDTVLGQYTAAGDQPGYLDDETVPKGSKTPTFATCVMRIHNERCDPASNSCVSLSRQAAGAATLISKSLTGRLPLFPCICIAPCGPEAWVSTLTINHSGLERTTHIYMDSDCQAEPSL